MINWSKPLQTRGDELPVRDLGELAGGKRAVAVTRKDGTEYSGERYSSDGRFWEDRVDGYLDVINVPEKRVYERWVNIAPDGTASASSTPGGAETYADHDRIACIHVRQEYEVGEGLDDE